MTDADAEQYETQHWIETALDCDYLTDAEANTFIERLEEIGRLLHSMMEKSHLFCNAKQGTVREQTSEYFTKEQ